MTALTRAISGFNQSVTFSASATVVSGRRSATIAARVASSTTDIVTASLSKVTADVQIGSVVGCNCQVAALEL